MEPPPESAPMVFAPAPNEISNVPEVMVSGLEDPSVDAAPKRESVPSVMVVVPV